MPALREARLYGIADLGYLAPEAMESATRSLIKGGTGIIQLRAKGYGKDDITRWARLLLPICREAGIPFIVNDHIEIAAEIDADGVHLGQDDGPIADARARLAPGRIVGRSTHSPQQALAALAEGADYIGFGPLFPTPTKAGRPGIGLENVRTIQDTVGQEIPVFCIGGIKRDNLGEVIAAGAGRVVIVSDLLTAPDVAGATREVVARF